MMYVLNLTDNLGNEKALTQSGNDLLFDRVKIPHFVARNKLDIRKLRNGENFDMNINDDISIEYENGDMIIVKNEEQKNLPTRVTLLVSSARVTGIDGMKEVKGKNLDLTGVNLVYPSLFVPLGVKGGYHFALVISSAFDFAFEDGTYHVDVPCMTYSKVK